MWKEKNISGIGLAALTISTLLQLVQYFQTKRQLITPLIPRSTVNQLANPFLQCFLGSLVIVAVAILLHVKRKYVANIILCGAVIVLQQYYPGLALVYLK